MTDTTAFGALTGLLILVAGLAVLTISTDRPEACRDYSAGECTAVMEAH